MLLATAPGGWRLGVFEVYMPLVESFDVATSCLPNFEARPRQISWENGWHPRGKYLARRTVPQVRLLATERQVLQIKTLHRQGGACTQFRATTSRNPLADALAPHACT